MMPNLTWVTNRKLQTPRRAEDNGQPLHIDEDELELYALGRSSEKHIEQTEIHLLRCEECQNRLLEVDHFIRAYRRLVSLPGRLEAC